MKKLILFGLFLCLATSAYGAKMSAPGVSGVGSAIMIAPAPNCPALQIATSYYVSPDGDNADGLSWETAWQTFGDIVWATVGDEGALVYIDEGRWEETLVVEIAGSPINDLGVDTYEHISAVTNTTLANAGWLVITVGSSDGVLDEQSRIVGSRLQGKTVEGTANAGFSNTSGNVWEVALTTEPKGVWEAITTDLTTKDAAVPLTLQSSVVTVEANAGSYWWDSNVLYVHKTGGGDVSVSLYDYEAIPVDSIPLDISLSEGVVFDGGAGQNLRFSYGDNDVYNGIIKGATGQGSTIFRNMQMLYADTEDGHYMNGVSLKSLFYNNNMGKATGNQAFSQSNSDAGTYDDIEHFFINNTIWDGMETHGSIPAVNNIASWYVKNNTMRYERLGDFGGNPGAESLIRLANVVGVSADIQVTGNTLPDEDEHMVVQTVFASAISIITSYVGTGTILVDDNTIVNTGDAGVATGSAIFIKENDALVATVSNNTIEGFTIQAAIRLDSLTAPVYIDGNSTKDTARGVFFNSALPSEIAYIRGNNFQEDIVISINGTGLDVLYFERNICIAQGIGAAGTFMNFNGLTHLYMKNNFVDQTGTGDNVTLVQAISTVNEIIGNIFTGSTQVFSLQAKKSGSADIMLYGNVFYNNDTGFSLGSDADCDVYAKNNIFLGNAAGMRNDTAGQTIFSDYNYFWAGTFNNKGTGTFDNGANIVDTVDPLMVSPATGDFSLSGLSPCLASVNAGVDLGAAFQIPYRFITGTDFTNPADPWYVVNGEPDDWGIGDLYTH